MENLNPFRTTLDELDNALKALILRWPGVRQRATATLAHENAWRLFARALGRLPTQGEAATWLGRRTAPLLALHAKLDEASNLLIRRNTHELLHGFWTSGRLALLADAPGAMARIQQILSTPIDSPHGPHSDPIRYTLDLICSVDPDGTHGLEDAWRSLAAPINKRFPKEQAKVCQEVVLAAGLDPHDEAALLDEITRAPEERRLYGYNEFFRNDEAARQRMLIELGLEGTEGRRRSQEMFVSFPSGDAPLGPFTCEKAFRCLVESPDAFLETGFELGLRTGLLPRMEAKLASDDEIDQVIMLIDDILDGGCLRLAGDDNPFVREAMFRFFEAIGLDPRTEAAFVTDGREVGSRRYSGTWHLYPVPDRGYVLALGMDQFGAGRLDACKGSLDTVKASLAHHRMVYYVPGRSDEESARLYRELDPAPDRNPNFFAEYAALFDPAKITEQYALREEFLAKDVKP